MSVTETHKLPAAETARAHIAAFDGLAEALPGKSLAWLNLLRSNALSRFAAQGLPTRRLEAWKFTGLDALTRAAFAPTRDSADVDIDPAFLKDLAPIDDALRLVFVNGTFRADLSGSLDAPGTTVAPLSVRLEDGTEQTLESLIDAGGSPDRSLVSLNAAFMSDGAVIELKGGDTLKQPIVLIFLTGGDGRAAHARNLISLGEGAEARVIEVHATLPDDKPAFSNTVTDIRLAKGSRLHHARIAAEDTGALHHSFAGIRIGEGAHYASCALSVGGNLSRQETEATFDGPNGHTQLLGLYLARGRQHMDHMTRVTHAHPDCSTEELFKGVMDERGHGVFQGLVHVAPHAIHTDAQQQNRNLLLSDRAVADTKPELEILADDVKCSHGATVGDLDADELFYLLARGITPEDARRLLLAGYVGDVTDRIKDEAVRKVVRTHAQNWLGELI